MTKIIKEKLPALATIFTATFLFFGGVVLAQPSTSSNYMVEEATFGAGGELDASSSNFRAQSGVGFTGVGDASSANFGATAGFLAPDEVFLELVVTGAVVDLGVLDPNTPSSGSAMAGDCNCSFYVRSYLASQYAVYTVSDPPSTSGGATLDAKSTLGVPSTNALVEEFGMNVVENTSPAMGADPENIPDNNFADGTAATGYDTPNQFRYGVGDLIASSPATVGNESVGQTNYTISYIAKSSLTSPAGLYSMNHVLVATGVF